MRRVIAGYLIWREDLLAEVESQVTPTDADLQLTIRALAKRLYSRNRRGALVSALALGRIGPAAIPALEEVVRRRVRTSRDMLAIESALLALQHIGLEAKLVVKPLADHRHRKICRAANLSLEWIAL